MPLNGPDMERLRDALVAAYDSPSLETLLRFKLNMRLDALVSPNASFETIVFQLLNRAEREGWLQELIEKAAEDRAQNRAFAAVCGQVLDKYATSGQHQLVPIVAGVPFDTTVSPPNRRRIARPGSRLQRPEPLRPKLTVAFALSEDYTSTDEGVRILRLSSIDWVPYYEYTDFIDAVVLVPGRTPRKMHVDLPPRTVYVAFRLLNVGNVAAEKPRVRISGEGVRFRYGNQGLYPMSRVWEVEIAKTREQDDGDMLEVRGANLPHGEHYDTYELLLTLERNRAEYTLEWHAKAGNDKREGGVRGTLTISVTDAAVAPT